MWVDRATQEMSACALLNPEWREGCHTASDKPLILIVGPQFASVMCYFLKLESFLWIETYFHNRHPFSFV